MKVNQSRTDRAIRVVAGLALLAVALFASLGTVLAWALGALGAILVLTGAAGFCPLYALLKTSTNRTPATAVAASAERPPGRAALR